MKDIEFISDEVLVQRLSQIDQQLDETSKAIRSRGWRSRDDEDRAARTSERRQEFAAESTGGIRSRNRRRTWREQRGIPCPPKSSSMAIPSR